jgi:hypothetical protein
MTREEIFGHLARIDGANFLISIIREAMDRQEFSEALHIVDSEISLDEKFQKILSERTAALRQLRNSVERAHIAAT